MLEFRVLEFTRLLLRNLVQVTILRYIVQSQVLRIMVT